MYQSRLILGAALLCLAGVAGAQTTSPDRPSTTTDKPSTTTPAPSTSSPGVTSTTPSPSAPMASDTRTTTTESRTYRDPATGRMSSDPSRMDTARAPRADRN